MSHIGGGGQFASFFILLPPFLQGNFGFVC